MNEETEDAINEALKAHLEELNELRPLRDKYDAMLP